MSPTITPETTRPWYREPFVWLLIALPLSAVIASISTAIIAVKGADSLVADNYYRRGLAINQDTLAVDAAHTLGIRAHITVRAAQIEMRLDAPPSIVGTALTLSLHHPADSRLDQELKLHYVGQRRYLAALNVRHHGYWYVDISPTTQASWILKGQLELPYQGTQTLSARER